MNKIIEKIKAIDRLIFDTFSGVTELILALVLLVFVTSIPFVFLPIIVSDLISMEWLNVARDILFLLVSIYIARLIYGIIKNKKINK